MKVALARRPFREEVELSILGLGGMVLVGMEQNGANTLVSETIDRGVNYFDVAPFYGEGEAELKLGEALAPYRSKVFLACKTLQRTADGARSELERSLQRLRTDHIDLYQFHAVVELEEVKQIFSPGGAVEAFNNARREGKIRFIGFSAHSVEAALAMLEQFSFDSVLFPVNYICYAQGHFGPQVLQKAKRLGVARLALKSMAYGRKRGREDGRFPNCWYRPIEDRALAREALRFTLSEDVTAAIPPGDERLFRMALALAADLPPLTPAERTLLLKSTRGLSPLLRR
ncbi:MAG TPA: aldo/keto reductase [Acidobacteriota bacterium]|nr:aldo/keto reductase [Acidobacteriota bacterium]